MGGLNELLLTLWVGERAGCWTLWVGGWVGETYRTSDLYLPFHLSTFSCIILASSSFSTSAF